MQDITSAFVQCVADDRAFKAQRTPPVHEAASTAGERNRSISCKIGPGTDDCVATIFKQPEQPDGLVDRIGGGSQQHELPSRKTKAQKHDTTSESERQALHQLCDGPSVASTVLWRKSGREA